MHVCRSTWHCEIHTRSKHKCVQHISQFTCSVQLYSRMCFCHTCYTAIYSTCMANMTQGYGCAQAVLHSGAFEHLSIAASHTHDRLRGIDFYTSHPQNMPCGMSACTYLMRFVICVCVCVLVFVNVATYATKAGH